MIASVAHPLAGPPWRRGAPSRVRALFLLLAVLTVACDSDNGDERARTVTLTPAATNGAAVITLHGGLVASVSSDEGQVFFSPLGDSTRVVLVLDEPGPLRFDLLLEDPAVDVVGTVIQVADAQNRLRSDVAQYRVEVNR